MSIRIVGPDGAFGQGWDAAAKQDAQEFKRLDARIAELELALGQIAHFNSPDHEMGFMEERDTLIAIARNALGLQTR